MHSFHGVLEREDHNTIILERSPANVTMNVIIMASVYKRDDAAAAGT